MWKLDHKENWVPNNWCFQIVVLEKTLESPLDCKEIKAVNPKENQPWIFIERTDAEAEARILWPPYAKKRFTGKDWCWERLKAKGKERKRMRWLDGIIDSMDMSLSKLGRQWRAGKPGMQQSMGLQSVGHDWMTKNSSKYKVGQEEHTWSLKMC